MGASDEKDYARNEIVRKAVSAAYAIIMEGSDGSVEETDYLTARVAEELIKTALSSFSTAILKKDMEDRDAGS